MKLRIGIDDKVYEVDVEVLEDLPVSPVGAALSGTGAVRASSAGALGPPAKAPKAREDLEEAKVARSPVHGLVVKVVVKPGQAIHPDDVLLVLEAMKMESAVTSAASGVVKEVRVQQGERVEAGQVLVVLE